MSTGPCEDFEQHLKVYYDRLFPHELLISYLCDGRPEELRRREFSFTLKGDVYLRYKSYSDAYMLKADLMKLIPYKIDIGAVYNYPPSQYHMHSVSLQCESKELVFDIDLSDYDDIRTCCKKVNICKKCWVWAALAVKFLSKVLKSDFGFDDVLVFFSGRRGVHLWVRDERAKKLTNEGRKAIIDYIMSRANALLSGNADIGVRSRNDFCTAFERCIFPQQILNSQEGQENFLKKIENESSRRLVASKFGNRFNPSDVWSEISAVLTKEVSNHLVSTYTLPRLDVNVTTDMKHLLKAPFCVHPSTGKICVPISLSECDAFDPESVPTVMDLVSDLNEKQEGETKQDETGNDVEKKGRLKRKHVNTDLGGMKSYVQQFERQIRKRIY